MVQQVGRGRRAHPGMAAGFSACLCPRSPWVGVCGCQGLGLGALAGLALQGFCRGVFLQNSACRWWSPDLAEMRPGWVW